MRRRKVLPKSLPPWANLVEEERGKESKEDPEKSSGNPSATSASKAEVKEVRLPEQAPPRKRRRRKSRFDERPPGADAVPKRQSRFDERPAQTDISATMPAPRFKEDPLGNVSDPTLRTKLSLTGELATHSTKRKHHISDYLPKEELLKFLAKTNGKSAYVNTNIRRIFIAFS